MSLVSQATGRKLKAGMRWKLKKVTGKQERSREYRGKVVWRGALERPRACFQVAAFIVLGEGKRGEWIAVRML